MQKITRRIGSANPTKIGIAGDCIAFVIGTEAIEVQVIGSEFIMQPGDVVKLRDPFSELVVKTVEGAELMTLNVGFGYYTTGSIGGGSPLYDPSDAEYLRLVGSPNPPVAGDILLAFPNGGMFWDCFATDTRDDVRATHYIDYTIRDSFNNPYANGRARQNSSGNRPPVPMVMLAGWRIYLQAAESWNTSTEMICFAHSGGIVPDAKEA